MLAAVKRRLLGWFQAHLRWVLVVAGLVGLAVTWKAAHPRHDAARTAASEEVASRPRTGLAPDQEDIIEPTLGRGATLPDGCRYVNAEIASTHIVARYLCPGQPQPIPLDLYVGAPPGQRSNGGTTRFSAWSPPELPPAVRDAVFTRVSQQEDRFHWRLEGASRTGRRGAAPPFPSLMTLITQDPSPPFVIALVFLLLYTCRLIRGEPRSVMVLLAATVLAGVALRLGLAVEAPMNAHSYSRFLPLASELFRRPLIGWYSAYAGGDLYFTSVQGWANFALAVCMPLVFFAHARLLFGDARSALVAALLMAFLPMHIRFSRSDVSFIASLINSSFTFVVLYGWLTDASRAWRLACLALLPIMSLATYQARPENIIFAVLDLGALSLYLGRGAPRHRLVLAGSLIAATATYSVATDLLQHYGQAITSGLSVETLRMAVSIFFNPRLNTLVNPWMTPPLLPLLAVVGGVSLWRRGQPRRVIFLTVWLVTFFVVHSFVYPSTVAMQARYHLHLVSPFLLLAAAATPQVLTLPRPLQAALLAWALLMPALHVGFIRDVQYTEMQEYAFLRRVRGHIGPTCTVLEFGPAVETPRAQNYAALRAARMTTLLRDGTPATPRVQQIGAIPPSATRLDAAEQLALSDDFIAHPPACLYFYESAACTTHRPAPGRLAPVCEEMHRRFSLSLVAEESHPLRPYDHVIIHRMTILPDGTHRVVPTITPPAVIRLGLYRVTRRP